MMTKVTATTTAASARTPPDADTTARSKVTIVMPGLWPGVPQRREHYNEVFAEVSAG